MQLKQLASVKITQVNKRESLQLISILGSSNLESENKY
jgi:hypothetical protein